MAQKLLLRGEIKCSSVHMYVHQSKELRMHTTKMNKLYKIVARLQLEGVKV